MEQDGGLGVACLTGVIVWRILAGGEQRGEREARDAREGKSAKTIVEKNVQVLIIREFSRGFRPSNLSAQSIFICTSSCSK